MLWSSRGSSWPGLVAHVIIFIKYFQLGLFYILDSKAPTTKVECLARRIPFACNYFVPAHG